MSSRRPESEPCAGAAKAVESNAAPAADAADCQAADCQAGLSITELIERYHAKVYGYAYRLAGSPVDAEDVTQQTFLLAQQRLDQVRELDKVDRWLLAIARSCYLKSCRKKRPVAAASLQMDMEHVVEEVSADDIDRERLQQALGTLDEAYRLVLVMFYFQELSYKEIADELQIPIGTVMSRLARGKRKLRAALTADPTGGLQQPSSGAVAAATQKDARPSPS